MSDEEWSDLCSALVGDACEAVSHDPPAPPHVPATTAARMTADTVAAWRAGVARLHPDRSLAHGSVIGWQLFVRDAQAFVAGAFAESAAAQGWSATALFGCHRERPAVAVWWGATLFLKGAEVLEVGADTMVLRTARGIRQTIRNNRHPYAEIVPVWDLPASIDEQGR